MYSFPSFINVIMEKLNMSAELFYLLGALRDGSLPKCKVKKEITFASDINREWIEIVSDTVSNTFNISKSKCKIYKFKSNKSKQFCYRLKVYSSDIYKELSKYYVPGKQVFWKTPEIVKNSSLELQKHYIAGFYDAEGGCRDVEKFKLGITKSIHCYCSITCKHFDKYNEPLQFIQEVLFKFSINSKMYNPTELVFTHRRNIKNFFDILPFKHPYKTGKLEELLLFYGTLSAKA